MGEGTDVKLFCYIDAVDPDYWLLREKKEEGQKGGECNGCETASLVSGGIVRSARAAAFV